MAAAVAAVVALILQQLREMVVMALKVHLSLLMNTLPTYQSIPQAYLEQDK
jgi:hypothetical protein